MDVIKALYPHVLTLERWLYHCDGSGILRSTLVKDDDSQSFRDLVETTIVAMSDASNQVCGFSFSQNLHQREVVLRTIEKLIRCDGAGKNILTQGFNVISNDVDAHVSSGANVEYRYPNSNVNRLHFKVWKQLLLRIGDSMMMYLLEKASIFIWLAPTSYLQIAGPPIYNAWPYEVGKTFPVRQKEHQSNDKTKQKHQRRRFYDKTKQRRKNNAVKKKAEKMNQTSRDFDRIIVENKGTKRKSEDVIIDQDRIVGNENKRARIESESNCDIKINSQEYENLEKLDTILFNKTQAASSYKADDERTENEKSFYSKADVRAPVGFAMTFLDKQLLNSASIRSSKRKRNSVASELTSPEIHSKKRLKASKDGPNNETKVVNEKVDRAKDIQKFKPYDHLIYLPRADIFYHRNLRERVQRSTTIASLDSDRDDLAQFLYQKIFCETSVNADSSPVEVMVPISVQVIDPELTISSSNRGSDGRDADVDLQQMSKISERANVSNVEFKHTDACNPVIQDDDSISPSENDKRSQTLKNKTVLLAHPSFMNSDNGMDISLPNRIVPNSVDKVMNDSRLKGHPSFTDEPDSSFTRSRKEITNKTAVKGHPSFTNSKYDIHTLRNVTESSSLLHNDLNISCDSLGKKRIDMLMQRRHSILKLRKHVTGAHCDQSSDSLKPSSDSSMSMVMGSANTSLDNSGLLSEDSKCNTSHPDDSGQLNQECKDSTGLSNGDIGSKTVTEDNNSRMNNDKSEDEHNELQHVPNCNDYYQPKVCEDMKRNKNQTLKLTDLTLETDTTTTDDKAKGNIEVIEKISEKIKDSDETETPATRNETLNKSENAEQDNLQVDNTDTADISNREMMKIQVPVTNKLMKLLNDFVKGHRRCPYKVLLQHHCPVSWKQRGDQSSVRKKPVAKSTVARLLTDHIRPRQVYLFLRACFLKTVPQDLLGSSHNRNIVLKNVSRLVSMGKFEKLCLGQIMAGLKTLEIPWLQYLPSNNLKLHLLAKLILWIFKDYVFTLLKTYIYITETTFIKYRLLYYRQLVWHKLHMEQFSQLLKKKILKAKGEKVAEEMLSTGQSLGVCFLRFIPKQASLRPIMNMSRTSPQLTSKKMSINQQLMDVLHILTYMKNQNPSLIGSGKFGMDDVYVAWSEYNQRWTDLGRPELYFVKTDIVNCYDTILQKQLYSVLEDIFSQMEEEFVVRKYASVLVARGNLKRTFHRAVTPLSEYEPDFVRVAKEMTSQNSVHDVILVDKVLYHSESKESLLQLLQKHLFNNIVKVGSKYYHQTCGISQGSVLSTLLCSLYYANMEQDYFQIGKDDLLMRIVDDYLYITPSKESAARFLDQMLNGFPEYNCYVNAEKVLTNFEYSSEKFGQVAHVKETFPWCGMLLNTKTLEVGVEYGRYSGNTISDSITFDLCHKPGLSMKKKILFSCRPKCHSVFMDPAINSDLQICVNCYQLFLLSAYKLHAYNVRFPWQQRANKNARFFHGVIQDLWKYVYTQVNKQLKSKKRQDPGFEQQFLVGDATVKWLCLKALYSVLHRHHSLYTVVLARIRRDLRVLERTKAMSKKCALQENTMLKLDQQFAEMFH